jgi:hypothetical protein
MQAGHPYIREYRALLVSSRTAASNVEVAELSTVCGFSSLSCNNIALVVAFAALLPNADVGHRIACNVEVNSVLNITRAACYTQAGRDTHLVSVLETCNYYPV